MQFPENFFEKETRDGFEIEELMKRAWAAAIEVLEVIDDICKRHEIKWYADWGTLLGAIRHNGFIPWDDDIDICMLRDEYVRFIEIARKELPEGFVIAGMYADEKRLQEAAQVEQLRVIADETYWNLPNYMNRFHGFPCFRIGIDIFPLDYVSRDPQRAKEIYEKYYFMMNVLTHWENYSANGILEEKIARIERELNTSISRDEGLYNTVWKLSETLISSTEEKDADYVTNFFIKCLRENGLNIKKENYDAIQMHKFEFFEVPVPAGYDEVLTVMYGDYMTPVKRYYSHDYPFYKEQAAELERMLKESGIDRSLTEFCRNWQNANDGEANGISILDNVNNRITDMTEMLATFLCEEDYQGFCNYIGQSDVQEYVSKNKTLFTLNILANIYLQEKEKRIENTILNGRDMEEVLRLYEMVTFCIRRVEFALEEDYILEAISFLIENSISLTCVIGIIYANVYFYRKEPLVAKMVEIYNIMGEM
ncbi:MAG: LicD family protein [Lachnospiraceae bacterium]|nr:LicD family protein [Candidatus Colinaster scatohippi]